MFASKTIVRTAQYQIGTTLYYVIGEGAFPLLVTQTAGKVKVEVKTQKEIENLFKDL